MLIDDFSRTDLVSRPGTRWHGVSDRVMGGISEASVAHDVIDGRAFNADFAVCELGFYL